MRLSDFRVLSFDCYGTLIDWETGLTRALEPLARSAQVPPAELLERFAAIEHELEESQPALIYRDLLVRLHRQLARELGAEVSDAESAAFGASVGDWPPFPDSGEALRYLKQHFALVILSNVDKASFARSNARLGVAFDEILTAEEIGSYKPDRRNFEFLLNRLSERGFERAALLHVAQSLFHDHVPANQLGIASAWIDRRAGRGGGATLTPEPMPRVDFRFPSLGALADAHRAELSA